MDLEKGDGIDILEFVRKRKEFFIYKLGVSILRHESIGCFGDNAFELPG